MKTRLMALVLALVLALGCATTTFAETVSSPTTAPEAEYNKTVTQQSFVYRTTEKGKSCVKKTPNKANVKIKETITVNGYTYKIHCIVAKSIKSKVKNLTVSKNIKYIRKNAFLNAAKIKTITIKCPKGRKASFYTIEKKAFNSKYTKKATIRISKNMKKSEYNKLKKKFRKAGFKGKFKRY